MLYVDSDMDGVSRNHIKVSVDENDVCRVSLLGVNESLLVSRGEEDEEDEGRKQPKRLQRGVPLVAREGDYIYVDWYRLDKVKGVEPECVFKVVKVDGKEGEDMDETTEYENPQTSNSIGTPSNFTSPQGRSLVNISASSSNFLDVSNISATEPSIADTSGYLDDTLNTTYTEGDPEDDDDFDPDDSGLIGVEEEEESDFDEVDSGEEDWGETPPKGRKKRGGKKKGGSVKKTKKSVGEDEKDKGYLMGDGTVFHSQEDEEKMRQHKIKLAKRNANEGRERMGEKEEGDMVPITQADNGNSPMGLSQATTISKTSNSRNSFGGEAEEEQEEEEENENEVSFKSADTSMERISNYSKSPCSSSGNLASLVTPMPPPAFLPFSSRLPAAENTFATPLWQHLNSTESHLSSTFIKEFTIVHRKAPPLLVAGTMPLMQTLAQGPKFENNTIVDPCRMELISSVATTAGECYPAFKYSNGLGVSYLISDFIGTIEKPANALGTNNVSGSMDEALSALSYVSCLLLQDVEAGEMDKVEGRIMEALVNGPGGARGMLKRTAKEVAGAWGKIQPLLDEGLVFGWSAMECLKRMNEILGSCIRVYRGHTGERDAADVVRENMLLVGKGNGVRDAMLAWMEEGEVKEEIIERLGKKQSYRK